ncbi:MAG: LysR substrate-binding domain-containing protein [Lysobacter sp.]
MLQVGQVSVEGYAACRHVVASRHGRFSGAADDALDALGLQRTVPLVVPTYPEAMRVVRSSDLIAFVPRSCLGNAFIADHAAILGLEAFEPRLRLPEFNISAIWHPRLHADPAHRWLRAAVRSVCRAAYPP